MLVALMAAVFLACCIAPARAWAATITVGPGEECDYDSLSDAVRNAKTGDVISLQGDIEVDSLVFLDGGVSLTIDGNGHTATRADSFSPGNDGRGGYNPAMIEVANSSTLVLQNITLDDAMRTIDDPVFEEQRTSGDNKGNEVRVQDAIIAAYAAAGDGPGSTIVLGSGTTLKNFGGMSAVRVGGQGKEASVSSRLVMQPGSLITDDSTTLRAGGVAAVWSQGGIVEIQKGASISGIDGRAIFSEDGGSVSIAGTISDISANEVMMSNPYNSNTGNGGGAMTGFGGIAVAALGNSSITLEETGVISQIKSNHAGDVAVWMNVSTFTMEPNSGIRDIETIGLFDSDGGVINLGGVIENCHTACVLFRLRGGGSLEWNIFRLETGGAIRDCSTTDVGIIYTQGQQRVYIDGEISNIGGAPAIYLSTSQNGNDYCYISETGSITNIRDGSGIKVRNNSSLFMSGGEISNCSEYAIDYKATGDSIVQITGGRISGNNQGGPQVLVEQGVANDAKKHVEIAADVMSDGPGAQLDRGSVMLDEDYPAVQLGNTSTSVVNTIVDGLPEGYTANGSALWIKPSTAAYHFQTSNPDPTNKHSLYVAYVELDASGNPVTGASVVTHEVKNAEMVDVTLQNAEAGKPYAVMLVNAGEYSLYADDITIYTGGGKGNENYDGGFPKVTFTGCLPEITKIEVGGLNITPAEGYTYADQLLEYLDVSYVNEGGETVTSDAEPGEYKIKLGWNDKLDSVKINGNDVSISDELFGTLIVRYVENEDEAISGDSTHELLDVAPTGTLGHAEAVAKGGNPKFYTNNDESREVDAKGVQILDDDLLTELGDNRQQALEEKAAEHLGAPAKGKQWSYEFRYLDLVDAHNGNAWVSASEGTTVYLPYPEGVTKDTAGLTVLHFPGLHREYGIAGQADVAAAVAACEPETVSATFGEDYISFEVGRSGFSPFAVAWQSDGPVGPGPGGGDGDERPTPDDTGVSDWLDTEDHRAYLSGYGDGSGLFGVDEPMTRAEAATMFHNLLLDKSMGEHDADFPDLREGAYYVDAVRTLASRGIIMGNGDGTFAPDRPVTRAEFVAIAMRFTDGEYGGDAEFPDVSESDWFHGPVVGSQRYGWVSGYADGTFGPGDALTRGQATAIVNHMLGRAADEAWAGAHMGQVKTFPDVYEGHFAYGEVLEATNSHDYEWEGGVESWTGLRK